MPRELYVYYRVATRDADALRLAVSAMHDRLRHAHPGLQTRLLRRADALSGEDTWMETYAAPAPIDVPDASGVGDELRARIEREAAAWQHLRTGPRHTEVFEPCA
ncbi:MAG: DUF4936 domain-containing protein [Burkholderiales bacterium PBB1]|nr:MAG: DUF4936 domain-containing protein [Burkholderiales bacterium PBB1]